MASDPEEEDGLKACLAQQSRKQRGADIHPQPQSLIFIHAKDVEIELLCWELNPCFGNAKGPLSMLS